MIIDTTQTKMEFIVNRASIAHVQEQLYQVANDPNLVITTGPSWKTCSPGSPQDLAMKEERIEQHPDCCECPECLHDFYNPTYKILRKTIVGCRCKCGSGDFGLVVKFGVNVIARMDEPSFICKQCNKWEWYER